MTVLSFIGLYLVRFVCGKILPHRLTVEGPFTWCTRCAYTAFRP